MNFHKLRFMRYIERCSHEMRDTRRVDFRHHPRAYLLQRCYMVYHNLFVRNHWGFAAQLTFNTMMAIIPVFAIIFAVGRGFGFEQNIADWCREVFASQPQVANAILELSASYINYTHTGVVIGVGLLFMVWSVVSLFNNVEGVFNSIWGATMERSLGRKVIDYTAIVFFVPIGIVFYSGLTVFFYSVLSYLPEFQVLTPLTKMVLSFLTPLALLWASFMTLYLGIPNTKVLLRHVWLPALLGSLCIIGLQTFYMHVQVILTSYSLIYGSLAALPLFMVWLQTSWFIAIGFAELAHANQNLSQGVDAEGMVYSMVDQLEHSLVILHLICRRQRDEARPCRLSDLQRVTGYPLSHIHTCVHSLQHTQLILPVQSPTNDPAYTPSRDTANMTLGRVVALLVNHPTHPHSADNHYLIDESIRLRIAAILGDGKRALDELLVTSFVEQHLSGS
jgi:membrane protein